MKRTRTSVESVEYGGRDLNQDGSWSDQCMQPRRLGLPKDADRSVSRREKTIGRYPSRVTRGDKKFTLCSPSWRIKILISRSSHNYRLLSDAVVPQQSRERHLLKTARNIQQMRLDLAHCIRLKSNKKHTTVGLR